jgi:hypothetical protein
VLEEALIGNYIYMANKPLISETNRSTQKRRYKKSKYVVKVLDTNGYIPFFLRDVEPIVCTKGQ